MGSVMDTDRFLTKRGRRTLGTVGLGLIWGAVLILQVAAMLSSEHGNELRGAANVTAAVAVAWTVCRAVRQNAELAEAAYAAGKEVGLRSVRVEEVTRLR